TPPGLGRERRGRAARRQQASFCVAAFFSSAGDRVYGPISIGSATTIHRDVPGGNGGGRSTPQGVDQRRQLLETLECGDAANLLRRTAKVAVLHQHEGYARRVRGRRIDLAVAHQQRRLRPAIERLQQ